MAQFVHTKIISILLLVDLALAFSTSIEPLHDSDDSIIPLNQSPFNPPRTKWRPPIGPIVQVWFHNKVGDGKKIVVHPRGPKLDYGPYEINDNESNYIEIVGMNGNDIKGDFKWGQREAGGNVYVFERDSKRCTDTPMRFICDWNITVWGVLGVNDKDQFDILFKWGA